MSGSQNVNLKGEANPELIKIAQLLEDVRAKSDEAIKAIKTLTSTHGRSRSSPREKRKRHLVRWNPEVDLKLLLAIQYVCEKAYIAVPWDDVARVMGPATTGSDILDYLATTRTQMVARGLDVPPTLNLPGKIEKVNRNSPCHSSSSDDDDEAWDVDDSNVKYRKPMARRAKMSTKGSSKGKVHDDTDDGEHMNAEIIITGQRQLDLKDGCASRPKTDPRTLYMKGLVVSPAPMKKDVHKAVVHSRKVVDTVKSGSEHHHVKDHQTKGPDVPPPLNFPGKMKIDFIVSPNPAKKDVPTAAVQKGKVVTNNKNFSGAHDWRHGESNSLLPPIRAT